MVVANENTLATGLGARERRPVFIFVCLVVPLRRAGLSVGKRSAAACVIGPEFGRRRSFFSSTTCRENKGAGTQEGGDEG